MRIGGLIILFGLTALAAAIPIIFVIYSAGDSWQGVLPDGYVGDSEFYMLRMAKGTQIFPFGNNPFFIEHIQDANPALSIGDYLASIPLKAGLSVTGAMIFNSIFWNLIFIFLLWLFLNQLGIKGRWRFYLTSLIYLEVYGVMIRPVVLQIVLPFFMLFLLGLASWLRKQTNFNNLLLAIGTAGTLYIYPYTWQVAFAVLGLLFLWFLIKREWSMAISELKIIFLSLILAFPAIWAIYKIFANPLFPELLKNVGSIYTHVPSRVSFTLSRWVIVNFLLWQAVARFTALKGDKDFKFVSSLLMLMGWGIFIILMSPIITGRDGAIGDHAGRELLFWLSISVSVILYFLFKSSNFYKLKFYKKLIILVLLVINVLPVVRQYKRSVLQPFHATRQESTSVQAYAKPISWLNDYDKKPRVVWADIGIGSHIFILSRHYGFEPPDVAYQYWMSREEMQERFLIAKYFDDLTYKTMAGAHSVPLGLSYIRRFDDLNWKTDLCQRFNFIFFNKCTPTSLSFTLEEVQAVKDKEIIDLVEKNKKEIRPRINELINKYQITYAIKDTLSGSTFRPDKLKGTKEIYNDGRFIIYRFQ